MIYLKFLQINKISNNSPSKEDIIYINLELHLSIRISQKTSNYRLYSKTLRS